jgi:iron complex transport system ATP-binding protein
LALSELKSVMNKPLPLFIFTAFVKLLFMKKVIKPLIEVQNLSLWRDRPILNDISFRILPQESWVILGPNGSGKSSLLAALTGYLPASKGSIEILGHHYGKSDWREIRKFIGIVSSHVTSSIHENEIVEHLVISGKEAILNYWGKIEEADRKEAKRLLKQVGCLHLATHTWGTLSQGERQKVFIARALMARYKILILDEACAGLDLVAREEFLKQIEKIVKSKKSPLLIWVTHHLEEIASWMTHVLLLKKGKVLAQGLKKNILNSTNLSKAFERKIKVSCKKKIYRCELQNKVS